MGKGKLLLISFLSPRKNIKSHNPAFSLAREAQRKCLAKRKRRVMGSAQTRKFFEKNLTKNFHTLVQCEHRWFNRRAQVLWQKNSPQVSKFLKDGVRGRKAFFKKFSSPPKKYKTSQSRFFFGTRGAKKKLGKKKAPFLWALPKPASF